jgi:hypothetical protein
MWAKDSAALCCAQDRAFELEGRDAHSVDGERASARLRSTNQDLLVQINVLSERPHAHKIRYKRTHTHTPQLTPGDFLALTQGKPLPVKQEQAATSVSTGWPLQHEGGQCRTPFVDVVCQVMFGVNR